MREESIFFTKTIRERKGALRAPQYAFLLLFGSADTQLGELGRLHPIFIGKNKHYLHINRQCLRMRVWGALVEYKFASGGPLWIPHPRSVILYRKPHARNSSLMSLPGHKRRGRRNNVDKRERERERERERAEEGRKTYPISWDIRMRSHAPRRGI